MYLEKKVYIKLNIVLPVFISREREKNEFLRYLKAFEIIIITIINNTKQTEVISFIFGFYTKSLVPP